MSRAGLGYPKRADSRPFYPAKGQVADNHGPRWLDAPSPSNVNGDQALGQPGRGSGGWPPLGRGASPGGQRRSQCQVLVLLPANGPVAKGQ